MKYDFVVIGAGVSGLTSAVILAKNGYRVALVEKSNKAGPLLRGFRRDGIFFDTGFHHAGSLGQGEIGDVFFRYLGFPDNLRKIRCNPECFDVVRILDPQYEFRFPSGYERIRDRFHEVFPEDKIAIDKFLEAIRAQWASLPFLNLDAGFGALEVLKGVHGPGLKEFLDNLTDNRIFKSIVYTHCLLNGVPPQEQALTYYAYIVGPYYESVHRIQGGGLTIIKEFENALVRTGVDLFCGRAARELTFSPAGALAGVRLEDGTVLESKGCISTVHPFQLLDLVPNSLLRPAYVNRIRGLKETSSAFILYGESDSDLDILSGASLYILPMADCSIFSLDGPLEERPFNIAATCLQEDNEKSGFIAICPADIAETEEWRGSATGKRPEGYHQFKEEIGNRMLRHIESSCPELRGKIRPLDCSTPLTIRDYVNNPFGSMYGAKHRTEQYNPFPTTRIPGLLLAGQSIVAPGLFGAMISGFIACGHILGNEFLQGELRKCSREE
jgi:all-trans-retinol 13,14-reductase